MKLFSNIKIGLGILLLISISCVQIHAASINRSIKILAIGNSFSADAVESHLSDIANAAGVPMIIGNVAIAGGSLSMHLNNWEHNAGVYEYVKINSNGTVTKTTGRTIQSAVADEQWDYISYQQVSSDAGQYISIQASLPKLYDYVKANTTNKRVKHVLHQTWAYDKNSTHTGFANYANDQMKMYQAIVDAYSRAVKLRDFKVIVPAGTAIQNARTSTLGGSLTRDGYHLSLSLGRYIVACTWFEQLTGKSIIRNSYMPKGLTSSQINIAKYAAHVAVKQPKKVTDMNSYAPNSN